VMEFHHMVQIEEVVHYCGSFHFRLDPELANRSTYPCPATIL
jgi:hypothetical protein